MNRVVFLYVQLSGYMVSCLNQLANNGVEVHVVHYNVSERVPFIFHFNANIKHYPRAELNQTQLFNLVKELQPEAIFCSGWMDKGYLRVIQRFSGKTNTILMLDTVWEASLRQRIGALFFKCVAKRWFNYAWVPSSLSNLFMKKIGFRSESVIYGLYIADDTLFNHTNLSDESNSRFIFAGRHDAVKGLDILRQAYQIYKSITDSPVPLHIFGGKRIDKSINGEVQFHGFLQPHELASEFKKGGVLIVPSYYEPWGVVVQEALNCGLQVIASNKVGAAQILVKEGGNGSIYNYDKPAELAGCLEKADFKIVNSVESITLYSTSNWVNRVKSFCENRVGVNKIG